MVLFIGCDQMGTSGPGVGRYEVDGLKQDLQKPPDRRGLWDPSVPRAW